MQHFNHRYPCVACNALGYPPLVVPTSPSRYSNDKEVDEIATVKRHLVPEKARIVGSSMGSRTTLDFGLRHLQFRCRWQ